MAELHQVILFDVDDTLYDNDRFAAELGIHLRDAFGALERDRYWGIFKVLRAQLGRADYLAALQEFRPGLAGRPELLPELLGVSGFLLDYPFPSLLYPSALAAVAHMGNFGLTAVLSDGDIVFQPRKIQRSGIWDAVDGRVMITIHKEHEFDAVEARFPADHYVMVDDKPHLLAAMKARLGTRVTTVFVRQGHYAHADDAGAAAPPPDRTIEHIADLLHWQKDTP